MFLASSHLALYFLYFFFSSPLVPLSSSNVVSRFHPVMLWSEWFILLQSLKMRLIQSLCRRGDSSVLLWTCFFSFFCCTTFPGQGCFPVSISSAADLVHVVSGRDLSYSKSKNIKSKLFIREDSSLHLNMVGKRD